MTAPKKDIDYIRAKGPEKKGGIYSHQQVAHLSLRRVKDQGRDVANTKYLACADTEISSLQKKIEHRTGEVEVRTLIIDIMAGKEMVVSFIAPGPVGSRVSDPTLRVRDSYYVPHSEYLLYRMMSPEAARCANVESIT